VSAGQWLALAVAALLVFWMVGAYNRLVALRNTIGEAVQLLHELLLRREAAVTHLAHALRVPLAAEQAALDTWLASLPALRLAADALHRKPVMAPLAAALTQADAPLLAAGARVQALLEQHGGLQNDPAIGGHLFELRECERRLVFARQAFNDAAASYNEAARLFPTRLLTRLYGFGTAGRL
jgi:LemA protein